MTGNASRFPLFVDLRGKHCVVVGGGTIAARRVEVLARFGAAVTVIAPVWQGGAEVRWVPRPYAPGDLAGAFLAVAATDDREVNRQVGEEAKALGIPVTVADRREECTFFFPAICTGGGVTAGLISQSGGDHHRAARAAKAVRQALEELD